MRQRPENACIYAQHDARQPTWKPKFSVRVRVVRVADEDHSCDPLSPETCPLGFSLELKVVVADAFSGFYKWAVFPGVGNTVWKPGSPTLRDKKYGSLRTARFGHLVRSASGLCLIKMAMHS
jgi:hypothetical protein